MPQVGGKRGGLPGPGGWPAAEAAGIVVAAKGVAEVASVSARPRGRATAVAVAVGEKVLVFANLKPKLSIVAKAKGKARAEAIRVELKKVKSPFICMMVTS